MSALLYRLALAVALTATPAFADTDAEPDKAPVAEENAAESEKPTEAKDEEINEAQQKLAKEDEEWAEKLRKRHHEGDVALGVCGARLTALMWFYQASVVDGRTDLEPAYEALKESREVLKKEAERRAVDDGIGTSVSVMNEHSTELWDKLVDASEKPDTFQETHDALFTDVQECLDLFFRKRQKQADAEAAAAAASSEEEDDSEDKKDDKEDEKAAD